MLKQSMDIISIEIEDDSIGILDSDCRDKICIKSGFISKPGQLLVCLPHKLMIEIKSNVNEKNIDIIPLH